MLASRRRCASQSHGWLADDAPPEVFRERYALLRAAAELVASLAAAPLTAPILAVWTQESLARHGGPAVDWQRCTRGRVDTLHVPGDHQSALSAEATCAALRARLAPAAELTP
jgi:surfactin synthase thioesterase subunit